MTSNIMTSNIFPVKREPRIRTLIDSYRAYGKFVAPEQFQRPQAWGKNDKRAYFESILMNRLEGGFVMVDLNLASKALDKVDSDDRAVDFFKDLILQGYKYITLDGNNRFSLIRDLLNGDYKIPTGTYQYILDNDDTIREQFICSDNNTFDTLPEEIQSLITDRALVISEYTQIHYEGLSDVFRNVNSGVPLNEQETRNAMNTPWSDWIRSLRKKTEIKDLLNTVKGLNHMHRLHGDEWLVQCIDFVIGCSDDKNVRGVGQPSMNRLYSSDIEQFDIGKIEDTLISLSKYLHLMIDDKNVKLDAKFITRPYTVMNMFWLMMNGLDSYEDVATAMVEYDKSLKVNSPVWPYMNDKGNNLVWACNGLGTENNRMKMAVLNEILETTLQESTIEESV